MNKYQFLAICLIVLLNQGCRESAENSEEETPVTVNLKEKPEDIEVPEGMVWIPGGKFQQGALDKDNMASNHEKPAHPVVVDGFFMSTTEVTNAQFEKFVDKTGYMTIAEREIDWEEIKKQLPAGALKPHDSILQPGSLIFKKTPTSVANLYDHSKWWEWKIGANWRHPQGPQSSINGKDNYPVVHITYEDAVAYCKWSGTALPTEAQWEYAARGGLDEAIYFWGNDPDKLSEMANTWDGEFPTKNTGKDGFEGLAPVKSFPPNNYGLYDIAGNVWELTEDWYNVNYYKTAFNKGVLENPEGAKTSYNPQNPKMEQKVIKGGSFLCNASYCASYRISARMANSLDSSQEHLGFRVMATPKMLKERKSI